MRRWVRQSFRRQLFVAFLAVTLLMVIGGGMITIQGFRLRLRQEYRNSDILQGNIIRENVMDILRGADEALTDMAGDKELAEALAGELGDTGANRVYTILYRSTAGLRDFAVASIYVGNERKFTTDSQASTVSLPTGFSAIRKASESPEENVYSVDPSGDGEGALLIARMLTDAADDDGELRPAYAVIKIRRRNIERKLSGMLNARDGLVLANGYLRPFCTLGTAQDGKVLSVVRQNILKGSEPDDRITDNVYISDLGDSGLFAVYITPPVLDDQAARAQVQILVFMAVAGTILCLGLASWMAGRMARPIDILTAAMRRLRKGDLEARVDFNREDEFQQLATGFNKTAVQLDDMMRERVENERQLNNTRIAMMQAQLNPHFLYNTLDTIKWVAKANQVPEVATLSQSLAGILRTSISEEQFVPLSQELKLVRNYCDIQRIRFDDFFDLKVDVERGLEEAYVPKLILQPIVENAIIHGLEDRREGHIRVDAVRTGTDDMEIRVTDNGKGIDDEMIHALESGGGETLEGHLGLEHVGTILRLYYGAEYGIRAKRLEADGEITGTVITLRIPVVLTKPENVHITENEQ